MDKAQFCLVLQKCIKAKKREKVREKVGGGKPNKPKKDNISLPIRARF